MPIPAGKCPNPDCRVVITGAGDVDTFHLISTNDQQIHAIVCKACGVIIGTAPQAR